MSDKARLRAVPDAEAISLSEIEAATKIADAHREIASQMPFDSPLRALALRSASRWGRIAADMPASLKLVR